MKHVFCSSLLALALTGNAAIPETRMDIPEARIAAAKLVKARQPQAAIGFTTALLKRDPKDVTALIIDAHANRQLGQQKQAQASARMAWKEADAPGDRYGAAMVMAQSLSSAGNKSRAQIWLRRAMQTAPTDQSKARAIRDYRYLRHANPWSYSFNFAISPTDNINNAPRDNTEEYGGLTFVNTSAVPLSGTRVSMGGTARLNFNIQQTRRDFASVFVHESKAILSSDAESKLPTAEASDYDYRYFGFELGRDIAPGPGKPRHTVSLIALRRYYGGDPLNNEFKLRYRQSRRVQDKNYLSWQGSIARSLHQSISARDATILDLSMRYTRPLATGGWISWSAGAERQISDSVFVEGNSFSLGAEWTHGKPIMGAELSLGLDLVARNFDHENYGTSPRQDRGAVASASLFFRELDSYGFAPKVTVTLGRTNSNVGRFETEKLGLSLEMKSVF